MEVPGKYLPCALLWVGILLDFVLRNVTYKT